MPKYNETVTFYDGTTEFAAIIRTDPDHSTGEADLLVLDPTNGMSTAPSVPWRSADVRPANLYPVYF